MVIKGARTIAEYRQIQAEKIQNWIDSNFVEGSVTWEMDGANAVKVTDRTGDSMVMDREIKEWNIIGGGMYKVELWIDLEE